MCETKTSVTIGAINSLVSSSSARANVAPIKMLITTIVMKVISICFENFYVLEELHC